MPLDHSAGRIEPAVPDTIDVAAMPRGGDKDELWRSA
jgi:hypothetical protein